MFAQRKLFQACEDLATSYNIGKENLQTLVN